MTKKRSEKKDNSEKKNIEKVDVVLIYGNINNAHQIADVLAFEDKAEIKPYKSDLFTLRNPNNYLINKDNFEDFIKKLLRNSNKQNFDRKVLLDGIKELYEIKDNTVYIVLLDGYVNGFDYGGCLNDPEENNDTKAKKEKSIFIKKKDREQTLVEKTEKAHNIYFLSLASFAKLNDPVNRCYSLRKYILIAIYRDVIRYKLQEKFMRTKGNRRCIFTSSTNEEISNIIFAIKYPTICFLAKIKIYFDWKKKKESRKYKIGVCIAEKELKELKPVYFYDRCMINLQNRPAISILLTILATVFSGAVAGIIAEFVFPYIKDLMGS